MCWFYLGIAQIALDPRPAVKQANVEKKVAQTILASPYTPGQREEKSGPNHPCKPLHPALTGNAHCPYGNNTFQEGASLSRIKHTQVMSMVKFGPQH